MRPGLTAFNKNCAETPRQWCMAMRHHKKVLCALLLTALTLAAASTLAQDPIGTEFVKIAPGEFTMGCSAEDNDCNADEKPAHRVKITKAFEIGKYEVTQAQ